MPIYPGMHVDGLYLLVMLGGLAISLAAAGMVKLSYAVQSRRRGSRGYTGAEAARTILAANGLHEVAIEAVDGFLTDHYDPTHKVLRLSSANYHGVSLAAIGVAAHEAGHAIQHARAYLPMAIRSGLVPLANIGSQLGFLVIFLGFAMSALGLVKIGIILYSALLLFQVVTLPVEFNASTRAKAALAETGIIGERWELAGVSSVLRAAALTYVAAAATTLLWILYFMLRAGLLGGRRD